MNITENQIITIDFDGCIAIGNHLKIKYAKEIHNININLYQCTRENYPLGPEKYLELMDIVGTDYILEYNLDPQCKQVLNSLFKKGFRFAIVTSREKQLLKACKKFVKYHQLPISHVYGTGKKSNAFVPKDVFINKLKPLAMLDDTLYKLIQLKDTKVQLFFLKRPWSEYELNETDSKINKIKIINDWKEFESEILKNLLNT